jgi:putative inorganic carbon (HCO3(-)) transporter
MGPSKQPMGPSKQPKVETGVEVGLLFLASPFLLFPSLTPIGTTIGLLILLVIWILPGREARLRLPVTPFNLALLLWLGAVLLGTLVSADPDLTLPKLTGLLLGVTVWRTIAVQINTAARLYRAVLLFFFVAAAMTLIGGSSLAWMDSIPFLGRLIPIPQSMSNLPAAEPTAVHANQLAGTILLFWPLSVALAWSGWPTLPGGSSPLTKLARLMALTLAVGGGVLLLFTQSRTGWAGGITGLGVLLWLSWACRQEWTRPQRWGWLLAGILLSLGLVLGLPLAEPWLMTQASPGIDSPLETLAFRFEVWRYALDAITDFPLTGTGLGTFREVVLRLYPITTFPSPDVAHAHNLFLQVALDTGLPGLVAYLAMLGVSLMICRRELSRTPANEGVYAIGLLACLVAFHVFGLNDAIAPGAKPGLLFWWLLGLVTAFSRLTPSAARFGIIRKSRPEKNGGRLVHGKRLPSFSIERLRSGELMLTAFKGRRKVCPRKFLVSTTSGTLSETLPGGVCLTLITATRWSLTRPILPK